VDIRRLARPDLSQVLCEGGVCARVSRRVLPVSLSRGTAVQNGRERFHLLSSAIAQSAARLSEPDAPAFRDVFQGVGGIDDPELRNARTVRSQSRTLERAIS